MSLSPENNVQPFDEIVVHKPKLISSINLDILEAGDGPHNEDQPSSSARNDKIKINLVPVIETKDLNRLLISANLSI